MRFTAIVGFTFALFTISVNAAPMNNDATEVDINAIPEQYIVVFKDDVNIDSVKEHETWVSGVVLQSEKHKRGLDVSAYGVRRSFNINQFNAYSAKFTDDMLKEIEASPQVAYVEPDRKVFVSDIEKGAPSGLARISHREPLTNATMNQYLFDPTAGEGITIYVVDSGILTSHTEFEGRATAPFNAVHTESDEDEHGHGTHVAATAGGKTFGVAKKAKLVSVKVVGHKGRGFNSDVIAGLDFAVNAHKKEVGKANFKGSVINMSLGSDPSDALDQAVNEAFAAGIPVVVAAGNDNIDACQTSPARVSKAITVGATDIGDVRARFSNFGKCVDVFAMGVKVLSAGIENSADTAVISGTSQATPHVSGLAGYFMSLADKPMAPQEVSDKITKVATNGILKNVGPGSPNLLAFNDFARTTKS